MLPCFMMAALLQYYVYVHVLLNLAQVSGILRLVDGERREEYPRNKENCQMVINRSGICIRLDGNAD